MPQLVKGGKYVFSWSKVSDEGKIVTLSKAFIEYHLKAGDKIILLSGSKTSGGFGLIKRAREWSGSRLYCERTNNR